MPNIQTNSDAYLPISGRLLAKTDRAVLFEPKSEDSDYGDRGQHWIPRSVLHAASDTIVDDAERGDEIELRVREWKLNQLGL